jgi:hypothetical protein
MFKKILAKIKSLFVGQSTPTLAAEAHSAELALNIAAPGVILVLQEAGVSEGSAEVSEVATEVESDLSTVSTALASIQAGTNVSTTVVSALTSIKSNIGALLTAGHIKNPQTVQTVTNVTDAFIAEVETIISEFDVPAAA